MIITRYSQLVMPQDANVVGTLFGGQMVSWMDISASKAVHRFLKDTEAELALTRAIDAIEFKEPVYVGNWVNFEASISKAGKSSIVIQINAFKESHEIDKVLACTALFTFVSVKKLGDGTFKKINHNKLPE
ncbi:MAG: acyl-CoA thioesterase [Fidelibacterota bacterium]|jgi:acyl-CoA thioesterase YciA|tara:strand:+ start:84 stop:476 length:393 start_codon:yes stop_codon:yes gene_type:complete